MKPVKVFAVHWMLFMMVGAVFAGPDKLGYVSFTTVGGNRVFGIDGAPLEGHRYRFELLAGLSPDSLQPVGSPVGFASGEWAGYINGGSASIPGVSYGEAGYGKVRAWDSHTGEDFEKATIKGESSVFGIATCCAGLAPPPSLEGRFASFSLEAIPTNRVHRAPDPWPGRPTQNVVTDGGFEHFAKADYAWGPGLSITCCGSIEGKHYRVIRGGGFPRVRQELVTIPDRLYQLRFAYSLESSKPLKVFWGADEVATLTKGDQGNDIWSYYTTRVTATAKNTKLAFETEGWAAIDDVRVEPIPTNVMLQIQEIEKLADGKMEMILAVEPSERGTRRGEGEFVIELSQYLDTWSLLTETPISLKLRDRIKIIHETATPLPAAYYRGGVAR